MPHPYREIELTQGHKAKVDMDDYDRLSAYLWCASRNRSGSFYAVSRENGCTLLMHREVLGLKKGESLRADHINHDTLDNRKENLRRATVSQNAMNGRKRNNNTSGYPGVTWHPKTGKWRVKLKVNRRDIDGGTFSDIKDAAAKAESLRRELHGEFAYVS